MKAPTVLRMLNESTKSVPRSAAATSRATAASRPSPSNTEHVHSATCGHSHAKVDQEPPDIQTATIKPARPRKISIPIEVNEPVVPPPVDAVPTSEPETEHVQASDAWAKSSGRRWRTTRAARMAGQTTARAWSFEDECVPSFQPIRLQADGIQLERLLRSITSFRTAAATFGRHFSDRSTPHTSYGKCVKCLRCRYAAPAAGHKHEQG